MAYGSFEYAGYVFDRDAIPENTRGGLLGSAIGHKMTNEVSSNVIRLRKVAEEAAKKAGDDFDEEEFTESKTKELRDAMHRKIMDGTVGIRISGPRGTTLENIALELASKAAEAKLAPIGAWPPNATKDNPEPVVDFDGTILNRQQLAEMFLEKHRDSLMAQAVTEHAARVEKAKLAKANKANRQTKVAISINDLF